MMRATLAMAGLALAAPAVAAEPYFPIAYTAPLLVCDRARPDHKEPGLTLSQIQSYSKHLAAA